MKPNWDNLLNKNALASVLPVDYAHFARPIRDGLIVFLSGLPESVQIGILHEQAALPLTATFSQRLGRLAQSCPVLHKLGQILARDSRLTRELRQQLCELESLPPTVSQQVIEQRLQQDLGPWDHLGITLQPPAIAEASVAVVIPFRYSRSVDKRLEVATERVDRNSPHGVFKILKPGIESRLERELALLGRVGELLDQRCHELRIPQLDYEATFQQVRDKLMEEVQLEHEQRHLVEAAEFYADEPRVKIPTLLDHCTPRVTAMEWVSGGKVTCHALATLRQKRHLAGLIAKALIARPIFSRSSRALFHGDPHAGNLFLTDDGRLAILDWSLVGRLGESDRVAVVQIMLAAITFDAARIESVIEELADQRLDRGALSSVVAAWVRRVRRGQFPGLSWLIGLLDDATRHARLRVGADLMLFRKTLHTLDGVVADVGETTGLIDRVLSLEFVRYFAMDWPQRWLRLPHSRDYATRLSNLDLTRAWLGYPAAAARFWTGHAIDLCEELKRRCGPPLADSNPADSSATNTTIAEGKPETKEPSCPSRH